MPISKHIDAKLELIDLQRLNRAYGKALSALHVVDRDDPFTDAVAKKVVELGASDLVDPQAIADAAVKHFRNMQ